MGDERLAEIEARANAATPGPWTPLDDGFYGYVCVGVRDAEPGKWSQIKGKAFDAVICGGEPNEGRMAEDDPDTRFIAHARGDVPDLIAEVRRLRAELDGMNLEACIEAFRRSPEYMAILQRRTEQIMGGLHDCESLNCLNSADCRRARAEATPPA